MDSRVLVLILVVAASGCTLPGDTPGETSSPSGQSSIEVVRFDVSDNTMRPGQEVAVEAEIQNNAERPVEIDQVSLYNLGFIEVSEDKDWEERCTRQQLPASRQGVNPQMSCSWSIKASEGSLEGFRSKSVTFNMNLEYRSELTSGKNPLKIRFKPQDSIQNSHPVSKSYSNGEVQMILESENPSPNNGGFLDVKLNSIGKGRLLSEEYDMSYSPESLFGERCVEENDKASHFNGEATFSCELAPTGEEVTRNLVVSTSYKYALSPSLDVEVVNR